jgi:sugar lactone lactonase YvrE
MGASTNHCPYQFPTTSCAFGGRDLTDLYVTTASDGLSHGELLKQPLAGGLFVCRGVGTGMPSPAFDG